MVINTMYQEAWNADTKKLITGISGVYICMTCT